VRTTEENTH